MQGESSSMNAARDLNTPTGHGYTVQEALARVHFPLRLPWMKLAKKESVELKFKFLPRTLGCCPRKRIFRRGCA
ncbi:hypothetical protein K7X08_026827 [Anisodus acutangulus]|uniref:Uncharacterized protein n=1 Tax=Anisodus acutangulus TaxID=402998 RepID=A0A9Q1LBW5_9SOLA|nr:hypothetical protein K7X08_026827 [Anisodus acutangulus]